jgi:hypothetical protein
VRQKETRFRRRPAGVTGASFSCDHRAEILTSAFLVHPGKPVERDDLPTVITDVSEAE